jgi:hypothetical protein
MAIDRFLGMPTFPKLVELPAEGEYVFVGDTHGDMEASEKIFNMFPEARKVFLGDYVDRGKKSEENVEYLLDQRERNPDQVVLLRGNHEGFRTLEFGPCDFWMKAISEGEHNNYSDLFDKLPLAVSVGPIIATHGGLPELENLADINDIELGDRNWQIITWGDWKDDPGSFLYDNFLRPNYGQGHFDETMARFGKEVMIRGHNQQDPISRYGGKLVTVFTSNAYGDKYPRKVAVANFDKKSKISSIQDLDIVDIDV